MAQVQPRRARRGRRAQQEDLGLDSINAVSRPKIGLSVLFRHFMVLLRKDAMTELRTRETLITILFFALLLVVIFTFSLWSDEKLAIQVAPGIIWISLAFAGVLAIERSFAQEQDGNTLTALILVPGVRDALFFSKTLVNLVYMFLVELLVVPLVFFLMSVPVPIDGLLCLFTALVTGTIGFALVGTVFSAMLASIRRRGVLLPIVLYPIAIPLLVMGVEAWGSVLELRPLQEGWSWVRIMAVVDVLYLVAGTWLFGQVLEDE